MDISMKWCIIERIQLKVVFLIGLLLVSASVWADSEEGKTAPNRHERKLQQYKKGWERLIPRYQKIQYAGSMGLISIGVGWDYGKKKQWETDLLLGYLPKFQGSSGHVTITLKENYIPWKINVTKSERWKFEPFTASFYINKIFGDEFWTREPEKYPDGYYGLATNLRFNLAFGQRVHFKIKPIGLSEHLTLFYEFGTNDLYIISYFTNRYLHFSDIFNLSLGIKLQFL